MHSQQNGKTSIEREDWGEVKVITGNELNQDLALPCP